MHSLGSPERLSTRNDCLLIKRESDEDSYTHINQKVRKFVDSLLMALNEGSVKSCCSFSRKPRVHNSSVASNERIESLIQGFTRDLTHLTSKEEKSLSFQRAFSPQLMEDTPVCISIGTLGGEFLDCSQSYSLMLGYSKQEMLDQTEQTIIEPEDEREADKMTFALPNGTLVEQFQVKVRRKDGTQFWAQVSRSIIQGGLGGVDKVFTHVQDISKMKEAQDQLEQKVKEQSDDLASARQMVNRLMLTANHETRNALNIIVPSIERLKEGPNADTADLISSLDSAAHHLLDVVNSNSDFNDLESGKMKLREAPFTLYKLLHEIHLNSLERVPSEVTCRLDIASNVPSDVLGDERRIRQMIQKLISNAIKNTSVGDIVLRVEVLDPHSIEALTLNQKRSSADQSSKDDNEIVLQFTVTDSGSGVSEEDIPRLFKPFEKGADGSLGVGLGLAITKGIAQLMGGWVNPVATSIADKGGSAFSLCIPLKSIQVTSQDTKRDFELESALQTLRNKKVLIVDDGLVNRKMLSKLVQGPTEEKRNVTVVQAVDGRNALDILREDPSFDVVFMDCQMPVMDGYTAIAEIRKMEGLIDIPIISVTGDGLAAEEKCFRAGANAFFSKPYNSRDVFLKIHELIVKNKRRNSLDSLVSTPAERKRTQSLAGGAS
jgi:PAS domain S-box-containing protein